MHDFIINASIQILPVGGNRHPYEWVDEAIALIADSGLPYEVGAFSTVVEGRYAEVMGLVDKINDHLCQRGCPEWISNLQIQIRSGGDMRGEEKTAKFR